MAKARGGLGRGLESLLGGSFESTFSKPEEKPAEKEQEKSSESDPAVEEESEQQEKLPENDQQEEESTLVEEGDIYTNKEDNFTIKSVVERKVPAPPRMPQKSKTGDPQAKQTSFEVDINLIEPNPDQPRTSFKKEDLEELAESIEKNGLLQPILVRKVGDRYQIIAGERRWQACKSIGMKKIPVQVKEADDDESIILALIENIQRSDLNPIEEAYGYRRMMERGKMTQSEVAQAVSKGRTTITNALRLLELPEEAQKLLFEEKITAGHARAILSIPTQEGRKKLTDKLLEEKLSVRDAERIARLMSGKAQKKEAPERKQAPKSYKTVAQALSDTLGAEVKIRSSKGKNKIEVAFKDEADLERLFKIIAANG